MFFSDNQLMCFAVQY